MKKVLSGIIMLVGMQVMAQSKTDSVTISGYIETYYSYDFNRPENNTRPGFLYNYNRHNEFNINLGYVKANYAAERVRGNIALAVGTYMNANYAAEQGVLKNIFEANAGFKLTRSKNLWLDVGIMPSHIGFESAIGKDNWTLTRSLVAENSPYFETGAKLSYTTSNNKLILTALALNGWQRITRVDNNSLMSWGTQLYFKPSDHLTLNYSTFLGTDKPDSARIWRYYHNIYGIWMINARLGVTMGFDIGTEGNNTWYTPVGIIRYLPNKKWAIAYRAEYFKDKNGVLISTGTPNGFSTTGHSLNIDYLPVSNIMLRLEGRMLASKDAIFIKKENTRDSNSAITFSTAVYF
jgi:hypothetical protein